MIAKHKSDSGLRSWHSSINIHWNRVKASSPFARNSSNNIPAVVNNSCVWLDDKLCWPMWYPTSPLPTYRCPVHRLHGLQLPRQQGALVEWQELDLQVASREEVVLWCSFHILLVRLWWSVYSTLPFRQWTAGASVISSVSQRPVFSQTSNYQNQRTTVELDTKHIFT